MLPQKELAGTGAPPGAVATPPLVDVNLITYNHEKFVARAIESVLEQQANFAYRLIIGDDCSTDNTQSIIRGFAQDYPERIQTLLASEHRGLGRPDRIGLQVLRLSTAKYIALLDGDDYWTDPQKLQKQVDALEQDPDSAICFHDVRLFFEDGSREPGTSVAPSQKKTFTIEDLLVGNFMQTCSVMFRNNLIGKVPTWYHESLIGDWPLHVMVAQHGKIRYLDEEMAAYRIHGGGVWSAKQSAGRLKESIKVLSKLNRHLRYKYRRLIKTTQCRYYEGLTFTYILDGDMKRARNSLASGIMVGLANYHLPSKSQLGKLLNLQNPALFNLYRLVRNLTSVFHRYQTVGYFWAFL